MNNELTYNQTPLSNFTKKPDQNVFDIMQGVSINIFVKKKKL